MITDEIKQFLDRTEQSLNQIDKVGVQLEVTLVEVRKLTEATTELVGRVNVLLARVLGSSV